MHEASLVESLLEQVRDLAAGQMSEPAGKPTSAGNSYRPFPLPSPSSKVTTIVVEIGPLSGVEPELVSLAYQRLAPEFGFEDARLEIRSVPLRVRCLACHDERSLPDLQFHCAACGARDVDIVSGDAFVLLEVQLETDDSPALETDCGSRGVTTTETDST